MIFSIIVPTLNEASAVANTLRKLSQLKVPHELIVADSGSTDDTVVIARQFADKIVTYEGSPRNVARGRNLGASVATGSFLVFVDADVSIPNIDEFFRVASNVFLHNQKLVAIAPRVEVLPDARTIADDLNCRFWNRLVCALNNHLHIGLATGDLQFMRASAFKEVGGYDTTLQIAEDIELYKRLAKVGDVRYRRDLVVMHPGRRPHQIGWPRLWRDWLFNGISVRLRGRTWDADWEIIR